MIVKQYRSYAGTKARYVNEQFIELFDLDLVTLPLQLPAWFVDQQKMLVRKVLFNNLQPKLIWS